MSASIKNNRVTVYFSNRKDSDILKELEGIESGDVSWFIKELMRDGIKHRKDVNAVNVAPNLPPLQSSSTGASFESIMEIEVKKKELTDEETESLFDGL